MPKPRGSGSTRRLSSDSPPSKPSAARPSRSIDPLFEDWSEFLRLLTRHRVRFLLIGGHAVSIHARPRHTEDLDVLIDASKANARRVRAALDDFGFGDVAPSIELLSTPSKVFMLGRQPYRIDLLTKIDGVSFREAWTGHLELELGGLTIPVIGRAALIRNKLASGPEGSRRPRDARRAPTSTALTTRTAWRWKEGRASTDKLEAQHTCGAELRERRSPRRCWRLPRLHRRAEHPEAGLELVVFAVPEPDRFSLCERLVASAFS